MENLAEYRKEKGNCRDLQDSKFVGVGPKCKSSIEIHSRLIAVTYKYLAKKADSRLHVFASIYIDICNTKFRTWFWANKFKLDRVLQGIKWSANWLLGQQHDDGYWCGELEANVMLEADYVFLHVLLGTGDVGKMGRAVNEILGTQNKDGGWSVYPYGPSNIDYSVKAYLALKLTGWSVDHPVVTWEWILANGGVISRNTYTKIYLCTVGQYDYDAVPAIPPEIVLFPNWFYFNINEMSSWSRGILVPLTIIYAKKPSKKLMPQQGIDELFVGGREKAALRLSWDTKRPISWRNFFLICDRIAHWAERSPTKPLRQLALNKVEQWMLHRFDKSDGLGVIFGAMLNSIVAMRLLGYLIIGLSSDDT